MMRRDAELLPRCVFPVIFGVKTGRFWVPLAHILPTASEICWQAESLRDRCRIEVAERHNGSSRSGLHDVATDRLGMNHQANPFAGQDLGQVVRTPGRDICPFV